MSAPARAETPAASERPGPRHAPLELLAQRPLRAIIALAAPTTAVMLMAAVSNVLHTYFVSRLGDDAIAAVSLVFPISLTVMTVVSGGIGAGAASGIARALGAGRRDDACGVAEHALAITALLSLFGTIATEMWGTALFRAMGGQGIVLDQATQFARVLFGGLLITLTVGTSTASCAAAGTCASRRCARRCRSASRSPSHRCSCSRSASALSARRWRR